MLFVACRFIGPWFFCYITRLMSLLEFDTGSEFEVRTTNDGGFVLNNDDNRYDGGGYRDNRSTGRTNNNQNSPIWLSEENNSQNREGGYDNGADTCNSNFTVGSKGLLRAKQARRPSRNMNPDVQQPEIGDEYDFGQQDEGVSYVVGGARGVASLRRHRS